MASIVKQYIEAFITANDYTNVTETPDPNAPAREQANITMKSLLADNKKDKPTIDELALACSQHENPALFLSLLKHPELRDYCFDSVLHGVINDQSGNNPFILYANDNAQKLFDTLEVITAPTRNFIASTTIPKQDSSFVTTLSRYSQGISQAKSSNFSHNEDTAFILGFNQTFVENCSHTTLKRFGEYLLAFIFQKSTQKVSLRPEHPRAEQIASLITAYQLNKNLAGATAALALAQVILKFIKDHPKEAKLPHVDKLLNDLAKILKTFDAETNGKITDILNPENKEERFNTLVTIANSSTTQTRTKQTEAFIQYLQSYSIEGLPHSAFLSLKNTSFLKIDCNLFSFVLLKLDYTALQALFERVLKSARLSEFYATVFSSAIPGANKLYKDLPETVDFITFAAHHFSAADLTNLLTRDEGAFLRYINDKSDRDDKSISRLLALLSQKLDATLFQKLYDSIPEATFKRVYNNITARRNIGRLCFNNPEREHFLEKIFGPHYETEIIADHVDIVPQKSKMLLFKQADEAETDIVISKASHVKYLTDIYYHLYFFQDSSIKSLTDVNSDHAQCINDFFYILRLIESFGDEALPEIEAHINTTNKSFKNASYLSLRKELLQIPPDELQKAKSAFITYISRDNSIYIDQRKNEHFAKKRDFIVNSRKLILELLPHKENNAKRLQNLAELRRLIRDKQDFSDHINKYFNDNTSKKILAAYCCETIQTETYVRTSLFGEVLTHLGGDAFITLLTHCAPHTNLAEAAALKQVADDSITHPDIPLLYTIADKLTTAQFGELLKEDAVVDSFITTLKQIFNQFQFEGDKPRECLFYLPFVAKLPAKVFNRLSDLYSQPNITPPLYSVFLIESMTYSIPEEMITHASAETFAAWLDVLKKNSSALNPYAMLNLAFQNGEQAIVSSQRIIEAYKSLVLAIFSSNRNPEEIVEFFKAFSQHNSEAEGQIEFLSPFFNEGYAKELRKIIFISNADLAVIVIPILYHYVVNSIQSSDAPYTSATEARNTASLLTHRGKFVPFVSGKYSTASQENIRAFYNLLYTLIVNKDVTYNQILEIASKASVYFKELVENFITPETIPGLQLFAMLFVGRVLKQESELMQKLTLSASTPALGEFTVFKVRQDIATQAVALIPRQTASFTLEQIANTFSEKSPRVARLLGNTANPWIALSNFLKNGIAPEKQEAFQNWFKDLCEKMMSFYSHGISPITIIPKHSDVEFEHANRSWLGFRELVDLCLLRTPKYFFDEFCTLNKVMPAVEMDKVGSLGRRRSF